MMLLSCWEETIEANERATWWVARRESERKHSKGSGGEGGGGIGRLKGVVRAQGLALKLGRKGGGGGGVGLRAVAE